MPRQASTQDTAEGPRGGTRRFAELLNGGDLEGAAGCFSREACLVTPDRTAVHGREGIREMLAQMIGSGSVLEVLDSVILRAGEVVLTSERWRFQVDGPEGAVHRRDSKATAVHMRIGPAWKLAVLVPWG